MATFAGHGLVSPGEALYDLVLFGVGALVMRGAGCTINDLWDRDIDKKVERTRSRPLASGALTPFKAIAFLGAQLIVGLAVLTQLNWYSIFLGASSLSVVVAYPLMKRITYWPQAVLGLAFNWGAMLGWASIHGVCNWSVCLPLYAAGVSWTLVYDTIYALQDKKDDIKVGIKSTALRFGANIRMWLSGFSLITVGMLATAGYMNDQGPAFYAISVGGAAAHFMWQLRTLKVTDVADAAKKFRSNGTLGGIIFLGIVVDYALDRWKARHKADVLNDGESTQ
ncbi:Para-hydroxybenzoate--polyprenyltransferase, mitochondrial precursor (PHB:polyprenyltransferase) [Rhizophlyctis rosea]|nr:Para-hydroxybenzoate--polyprenyltransferase, mitochondrial precursor (PHB:polyprenyltransferase) [Rhizophlyctis rosea]